MNVNLEIALIGALSALVGTFTGLLMTRYVALLQLTQQEKRDKREIKIKKFERIHELLGTFKQLASFMGVEILSEINQEAYESKREEYAPINELRMLVNFYSPELNESLENIIVYWKELGRIQLKIIKKHTDMPILTMTETSYGLVKKIDSQIEQSQNVLYRLMRAELS